MFHPNVLSRTHSCCQVGKTWRTCRVGTIRCWWCCQAPPSRSPSWCLRRGSPDPGTWYSVNCVTSDCNGFDMLDKKWSLKSCLAIKLFNTWSWEGAAGECVKSWWKTSCNYARLCLDIPFVLNSVICSFMNHKACTIVELLSGVFLEVMSTWKAKTVDVKFIFNSLKQLFYWLVRPQKFIHTRTSQWWHWLNANDTNPEATRNLLKDCQLTT